MNASSDYFVIIYLVSLVAIIVFIVVAIKLFDPMRKKIKEICGGVNRKGVGIFTVDGKTITMKYFAGSRNSSPRLKISTYGIFGCELVIRRETSRDKFYKKIGLNQEIQVPDKEIDEELFFECDIPEFTKQLFLNADVKPLALKILSYFNSIEITRDTCTLTKCPCERLDNISNEVIVDSARNLLIFVSFIPRFISSYHPEVLSFKKWGTALYFIGYGILACGVICFILSFAFRVVEPLRLWLLSIAVNILLFSGATYFAFQKIKGFSTSSRSLMHFIFSFGIGILLLGRYGVAVANGILDKTPVQEFKQVLVDKYTTRHKSSTTYHVVVSSWLPANPGWRFTESKEEYSRIQIGKTYYMIVTKSGRFGFEWVLYERLIR